MPTLSTTPIEAEPACPVFGLCGGCAYQDLPYKEELAVKEEGLKATLCETLELPDEAFAKIVPSPLPYHYRHRLDISMKKSKGQWLMGFQMPDTRRLIPINSCSIARKEISDFLPQLEQLAIQKMPADYRTGNLVVRTGDDGRVLWGGIGRHSLRMQEKDYLWTEIKGVKIFYSLDNFFQANLSILPSIMDQIAGLNLFDSKTIFFDLYSGVGLFGLYFAKQVLKTVLIEESETSVQLARFNAKNLALENAEIFCARVETQLPLLLEQLKFAEAGQRYVAMIDPPRKGLSKEVLNMLADQKKLDALLYLSCNPEALAKDLEDFVEKKWHVEKIIPFDFFPRTKHLETLVVLKP